MESPIQRGYLVLADISGYTSFIEETELDHGPKILRELILLILQHLTPTLTLAEVEGDAVFVYAPETDLTRGELLLELIEEAYIAFRDLRRTMLHNATCPCKGCQAISGLDLKFVAHYGEYVLQEVAGKRKPVGSCVNLAHRLLKNGVRDATGWRGYALFSEASLQQMGIHPQGLHESLESYEHLGDVRTGSLNLDDRYRDLLEGRHEFLSEEDADVVVPHEFEAPPPVVWDWLQDPHKRTRWMEGSSWEAGERPYGRTSRAAENHCTKSRFIEHILAWRPFEYYTVRLSKGLLRLKITGRLEPTPAGTRVRWNLKLDAALPGWMRRPLSRLIATRLMEVKQGFERMAHLIDEAATPQAAG